jgi:hypothetical protein
VNGNWIAAVAAIIVAIGGGGGFAVFRTIKATKAQLLAGARKLNAEAEGQEIRNIRQVAAFYIDELAKCQKGRELLTVEVEALRRSRDNLLVEVAALTEHVAVLEARVPERRHWSYPHEPERRELPPPPD